MQGITGSGAGGRIVSHDVAGAQAAAPTTAHAPTAGPYQEIELSNMRKVCRQRPEEGRKSGRMGGGEDS